MTLHIMIDGRPRLAVPYDPDRMSDVASALHEQLPILRQFGRVVVFVNDDRGVAHIIVAR